MTERLQKYLASCGVASRRKCEELIEQGKVKINGVVARLGDKVDDETDIVELDGKKVEKAQEKYYIMLNKPRGIVATAKDEKGRDNVVDLIRKDLDVRVFPVGRLDIDTEGLLLLTNDGDFANKIAHPSNNITKTYFARVKGGFVEKEALYTLRKGVKLEDGITKPAKVEIKEFYPDKTTLLEITISEGRYRQIRRMCEAVGHPVCDLMRIAVGDIKLGNLPYGKWRYLNPEEIKRLLK